MKHIKLRLRDKHSAELNRQADAVNYVWNYCNDVQMQAVKTNRKWLHKYDLQKLTAGSSVLLNLHAHTIQRVCHMYYDSRKTHNKAWLKWRSKKSLGWVPFSQGHVSKVEGGYKFRGVIYETMHDRLIQCDTLILAGSFNRDSRGRWYINLPINETPISIVNKEESIGIDLGIKSLATLSNGVVLENSTIRKTFEKRLGKSQLAKKRKQTRNIHAKIKNIRTDYLHKISNDLSKTYGIIVIGDVSSKKLAKSKHNMAKHTQDVSWNIFKNMIRYKSIRNGGLFIETSEYMSTQTCSCCGTIPDTSPKGIAGLGIREWSCTDCGTHHDRDVNAAKNILRSGLATLNEGTHMGATTRSKLINLPISQEEIA